MMRHEQIHVRRIEQTVTTDTPRHTYRHSPVRRTSIRQTCCQSGSCHRGNVRAGVAHRRENPILEISQCLQMRSNTDVLGVKGSNTGVIEIVLQATVSRTSTNKEGHRREETTITCCNILTYPVVGEEIGREAFRNISGCHDHGRSSSSSRSRGRQNCRRPDAMGLQCSSNSALDDARKIRTRLHPACCGRLTRDLRNFLRRTPRLLLRGASVHHKK